MQFRTVFSAPPVPLSTSLFTASGAGPSADPRNSGEKKKPKSESRVTVSILTGCVDQGEAGCRLGDEKALSGLADLRTDGFDPADFARHLGQNVVFVRTPAGRRGSPRVPCPQHHGGEREVFVLVTATAVTDEAGY